MSYPSCPVPLIMIWFFYSMELRRMSYLLAMGLSHSIHGQRTLMLSSIWKLQEQVDESWYFKLVSMHTAEVFNVWVTETDWSLWYFGNCHMGHLILDCSEPVACRKKEKGWVRLPFVTAVWQFETPMSQFKIFANVTLIDSCRFVHIEPLIYRCQ